jgi:hypothetical protein
MNTKQNTMSPMQRVRWDRDNAFNTQVEDSPIRKEIEKHIGEYTFTVVVEEDTGTIATMRHVKGLVSFLCTLTRNGQVLAQGRGSSVLGGTSKWMLRSIRSAYDSAVVDSVMRATKVLGTFIGVENDVEKQEVASSPITEKQATYLLQLIQDNVADVGERRKQEARISSLSKQEASELIASYR